MQPLKITFLGTSASVPTKERNVSGVLLEYEGWKILFDCGEGTQRQLMKAGKSPISIDLILITHFHGDHVFGLPGLLNTMELNGRRKPLIIYGPPSTLHRIRWLVHAIPFSPSFPILWRGAEEGVIFEEKNFYITAHPLKHNTETYGYVFHERDRRKLLKEKLDEIGVDDWRIYRKLKAGERVVWKGKELDPKEYTLLVRGRRVGYITDTVPVEIPSVDFLIHETTFTERDRDKAEETLHSTAKEVAELAKKMGARRLFLYHLSPRYHDPEEVLREAREVFPEVHLPKDLETIELI